MFSIDSSEEAKATIKYYDTHAPDWVKSHEIDPNFWGQEIARFHQLLPTGKILDVGCGGGRDGALLIPLGYEYKGIDASQKMLEEAKARLPKATFLPVDMTKPFFPNNFFDGFWASASLLHIKKIDIYKVLHNLREITRIDGIGFISIKEGHGEKMESDGRFFAYYQQDEFNQILKDTAFEVIEEHRESKSAQTTWLTYFVRVKKTPITSRFTGR